MLKGMKLSESEWVQLLRFIEIGSLLIVTLLLTASLTFAQTSGKISGKAADLHTHEPLTGVSIFISGVYRNGGLTNTSSVMGASTDLNGEYFILDVPPGDYDVRVQMIGYQTVTFEHVVVNQGRTTLLDIALESSNVKLAEVVVVGNKEQVRQDVAYSSTSINQEQIAASPQMTLSQILTTQPSIESDSYGTTIRGGTMQEVAYNVDGMSLSDNKTNRPYSSLNTELINNIQVITGGFDAEYTDARSGVVNVITKQSPDKYIGSINLNYNPAQLLHFGPNMWSTGDWWNYGRFLYMDTISGPKYVNPLGDTVTSWRNEKGQNIDKDEDGAPDFMGWDAYAKSPLNQYHLTSQQLMDLWEYQHRNSTFAQQLGTNTVLSDGNTPSYNLQTSFGGPLVPLRAIPVLGDINFFGGYMRQSDAYTFPLSRSAILKENGQLTLNYDMKNGIKLSVFGLYAETHACGWFLGEDEAYIDNPGYIIQNVYGGWALQGYNNTYAVDNNSDFVDNYNHTIGVSLTQFVSSSTYYTFKVQENGTKYDANPPPSVQIDSTLGPNGKMQYSYASDFSLINTLGDTLHFPTFPQGYDYYLFPGLSGQYATDENGYYLHDLLDSWGYQDSRLDSWTFRGDLTSQITPHHEFKAGFLIDATHVDENTWGAFPRTLDSLGMLVGYSGNAFDERFNDGGAYVQDKIEYPNFVMNLGLRFDYDWIWGKQPDYLANPNRPDMYGSFDRDVFIDSLNSISRPVPLKWSISPRFGINFPITTDSKMYLNYGQFTQIPNTLDLFFLRYGNIGSGGRLEFAGNAFLDLPKTTSFELGYEQAFADILRMTLDGYYKESRNQPQFVEYNNGNPETEFFSYENYAYWIQKGIELQLTRDIGTFFDGYANASWFFETNGATGPFLIRPDDIDLQNENIALQAAGLAKTEFDPVLSAKAGLNIHTPKDFGPKVFGFYLLEDWKMGWTVKWRQGARFHWDPTNQTDPSVLNWRWRDYWMVDFKLSRDANISGVDLSFYVTVNNIFNLKNFNVTGFSEGEYSGTGYYQAPGSPLYTFAAYGEDATQEFNRYMERIQETGKQPGDAVEDAFMPKNNYLTYLFPRQIWFGVRVGF